MTRVFEPERSNTFGVRPRCRTMLEAGNLVWCDWKYGIGCAPILQFFNYTRVIPTRSVLVICTGNLPGRRVDQMYGIGCAPILHAKVAVKSVTT